MAGTRSSSRQAAQASSSPASSTGKPDSTAGVKRKMTPGASPAAKRGKKADVKEQTTIEASMPSVNSSKVTDDIEMADETKVEETEAKHGQQNGDAKAQTSDDAGDKLSGGETEDQAVSSGVGQNGTKEETSQSSHNGSENAPQPTSGQDEESHGQGEFEGATGSKVSGAEDAVETSADREKAMPSNILEKGIIYFFFRGRVGIDEPSSVVDIARSYVVLRPLPLGAKLGDGPIGDEKKNRILALPKKVLPKSPKDRFMMFVEEANASMDDVKEILSSSDYATKTAGDRHTPAAAPIGEGVYAITQTGRDTHLAYILTVPSELSDVQKDIGLQERGSYVTSAKNPQSSGPASATLPQSAEFPREILDEFSGRGWTPLKPEMLNYENAQFLIIGHGSDALEKAVQPQNGEDKKPEKETPLEEVEKLEHEDELRVDHLQGTNHPQMSLADVLILLLRK